MSFTRAPKQCSVDGCKSMARTVSRYCSHHVHHYTKHGHAEGRAIRKHELAPFTALATRLIDTYGARADVTAALKWLDKLLTSSPNDVTAKQLRRLRSGGVKAAEVLHAVLALWAFHMRYPGSLPDDARLTYAIGRAVVRLRTQRVTFGKRSFKGYATYVGNEAFRTIGLLIREALGVLLMRLVKLHDKSRDDDAELLRTIRNGVEGDPADLFIPTRTKRSP